jgi:prepilin-type N-terminal cleavage/methylation domain-containing protein
LNRQRSAGFTLLEVAIVLLIIGLLFGGVLKASELILNARVRNLIGEMDGIQAAYWAFQDRYRARPGDYSQPSQTLNCGAAACPFGNGDGLISNTSVAAGGSEVHEELVLWTHLSASGLLSAAYHMTAGETAPTNQNSPHSPWGPFLELGFDSRYGNGSASRHNLKTGDFIPVEVLAETDRKIDDGFPNSGRFQFAWMPVPTDPANATLTGCTATSGTSVTWNLASPVSNCAATLLLE